MHRKAFRKVASEHQCSVDSSTITASGVRRSSLLPSIALVLPLMLCATQGTAQSIQWHVDNRFPLFKNPKHFPELAREWMDSGGAEGFVAKLNSRNSRHILPVGETWWNPNSGYFVREKLFYPTHDITIWLEPSRLTGTCSVAIDGREVGTGDCGKRFLTKVPEGTDFEIEVRAEDGTTLSAVKQKIDHELIIGIGDSFSSGEGNPDHPAELTTSPRLNALSRDWFLVPPDGRQRVTKQAEWWDHACHRSLLSWQSLAALDRAVRNPHLVVRYASFACSGAEIYDGFFRAQLDPPGQAAPGLHVGPRDGGSGYSMTIDASEGGLAALAEREQLPRKERLQRSQLNALIHLLCDGSLKPEVKTRYREPEVGLRSIHFGDFYYAPCDGPLRKPTALLLERFRLQRCCEVGHRPG
jgi:hypothetical protein